MRGTLGLSAVGVDMGWMGKKSEECMNTMNRGHVNMSSEWYVSTTNRRHVGENTEGCVDSQRG